MFNDARFDRHARLVTRMADTLGVDIETTVQEGRLLPEEFDLAVMNCMGCPTPENCERWMDVQEETAADAPGYCRNRETLAALAKS